MSQRDFGFQATSLSVFFFPATTYVVFGQPHDTERSAQNVAVEVSPGKCLLFNQFSPLAKCNCVEQSNKTCKFTPKRHEFYGGI